MLLVNIFFGGVFVTGVVANLFVIFLIATVVKAKVVTNIYIFNLAIADLMFVAWLPFVITRSIIGEWIWGNTTCKLFFICTSINQFGSVAILTALSIDRFVAVCYPIQARRIRTIPKALLTVAVCWVVVALLMIPVYKYSTVVNIVSSVAADENSTYSESQCMILWPTDGEQFNRSAFTIYAGISGYLIPLVIIWLLYAKVLLRLRQQARITSDIHKKKRSRTKVTLMVLSVVLSYTICWSPFWLLQFAFEIFSEMIAHSSVLQYLSLGAYCLQSANSVLNPLLYCIISGAYGKQFWRSMKKKLLERRMSRRTARELRRAETLSKTGSDKNKPGFSSNVPSPVTASPCFGTRSESEVVELEHLDLVTHAQLYKFAKTDIWL